MTKIAPRSGGPRADWLGDAHYQLVAVHALPGIDSTQTIRSALLSDKWSRKYGAFMRRHVKFFNVTYFIGLIYRLYGMLVPARLSGHWWLLLALFCQFPGVLSLIVSLRCDYVLVLMKSFEFWFFTVVNVVFAVALFVGYYDSRSSVVFMTCAELEISLLSDITMQRMKYTGISATMMWMCMTGGVVGVLFDLIPFRKVALWQTPRGHVLHVSDVLVHTMATSALLMLRLAYRNRHAILHTNSTVVHCVMCRCRLTFTPYQDPRSSPRQRRPALSSIGEEQQLEMLLSAQPATRATAKKFFQLEYVVIEDTYHATRVVFSPAARWLPTKWHRWLWTSVLVLAIVSVVATAVVPSDSVIHTSWPLNAWTRLVVLGLNAVAAAPFIALHQKQLLRRLFSSFDFLFVVCQFTVVSMGLCHLVWWAPDRCMIVACVWIWSYVAATHDALTPAAKHTLRWTPARATLLALLPLLIHVLLAVMLAVGGHWVVEDRVLLDRTVFDRRIQVFAIPSLFSRLAILLVWDFRILWRQLVCNFRAGGENELIMLQGSVQYQRQ